jgi:hypothetical protein
MSRKRPQRIPSYRHHKPSGQAVVTLNGKDFYLGLWQSEVSKAEYERLVGEWLGSTRPKLCQGTGRSRPRRLSCRNFNER